MTASISSPIRLCNVSVLPSVLAFVFLFSGCNEAANTDTPAADAAIADTATTAPPVQLPGTVRKNGTGSDDFNNYNISRDYYRVDPGFITEGLLLPGDGLDMSDPGAPQRRTGRQPLDLKPPMRSAAGVEDYTLTESFRLEEATSAKSEARILSAYFQGNYKFVSAEAALDQAREERKNSRSIYAVLDARGQVVDINTYLGDKTLRWKTDVGPDGDGADMDDRTFRRQFLLDYGSHYVSAITYGYRVAIRGKITQQDSSSDQKIKAAFKAAFLTGSAEGGVSDEIKNTLSSSSVELTFAATSGGLYQDGEQRPGILTRLDDIIQMLDDMKQGKIKIHGAPMEATARTYWNLLPVDYARSRALLEDHGTEPPPEPFFGVPKGTVIPWNPPVSAIRTDSSGNKRLYPPPGWALCNGEDGTPDLRDRFIGGTIDPEQIGKMAGAASHAHGAGSEATASKWKANASIAGTRYEQPKPGHTHTVTVASAANIPPYVKLACLMKL